MNNGTLRAILQIDASETLQVKNRPSAIISSMRGKIISIRSCLFSFALLGNLYAETQLSYEGAKSRTLMFLQAVPQSVPLSKNFGPDLTGLKIIVGSWSNLGTLMPPTTNVNQAVLLETVCRYFGDRSGSDLDLVAVGFQAPVFDAIPFLDINYVPTFGDPTLLKRGLEARQDYVRALQKHFSVERKLKPEEWGQIAASLTEAFTWLSHRPIINEITADSALTMLSQANLSARAIRHFKKSYTLKLRGVNQDVSDSLYSQFDEAARNWIMLASTKRPELFLVLYLEWLETAITQANDERILGRLIGEAGGTVEFVRQAKNLQSRIRSIVLGVSSTGDQSSPIEKRSDPFALSVWSLDESFLFNLDLVNVESKEFSLKKITGIFNKISGNPETFNNPEVRSKLSKIEERLDAISALAIASE